MRRPPFCFPRRGVLTALAGAALAAPVRIPRRAPPKKARSTSRSPAPVLQVAGSPGATTAWVHCQLSETFTWRVPTPETAHILAAVDAK